MGENGLKYQDSNGCNVEHNGAQDEKEEDICPETLEVVLNQGSPEVAPEMNGISEQTCEIVPSDT